MILQTKFDIDQSVWIMHNDKIYHSKIYAIELFKHRHNDENEFAKIEYRVDLPGEHNYIDLQERCIFATEEELIEHLKKTYQKV